MCQPLVHVIWQLLQQRSQAGKQRWRCSQQYLQQHFWQYSCCCCR
jgi:hypothetical protein